MKATCFTLVLAAFLVLPSQVHSVCTPTVQWVWDGDVESPLFPQLSVTPLVVQLTDDNGDGRIDPTDGPDVVFTHGNNESALITALDGELGTEHFEISDASVKRSGLAAGDIDGGSSTAHSSISARGCPGDRDSQRPGGFLERRHRGSRHP